MGMHRWNDPGTSGPGGTVDPHAPYPGVVSPPPENWRSFAFEGGTFQAADRPRTAVVEGCIRPIAPILMVTLRGGALRHELTTSDGLRFDGRDDAGMVSYLPAGCERRLRLRDVAWGWASITLPLRAEGRDLQRVPAFCSVRDPVIHGVVAELERLHAADGMLEASYCEAVVAMLAAYVAGRYGDRAHRDEPGPARLTVRQVSRIHEYVDAHLDRQVRVDAMAKLLELSHGHFHRAFKSTTGETPLAFVNKRRIERAIELMRDERRTVTDIALDVGFSSPSAFARQFRTVTKLSPSVFRQRTRFD